MLLYNLRLLQTISSLAIRPKGVIALDEHVIPKTGKEIEGVDYFYSTTHNKEILGLSMITTHYYGGPFEYPLDCLLYRRPLELEKRHHSKRYVPKNELARHLIHEYHAMGFPCKIWDCYPHITRMWTCWARNGRLFADFTRRSLAPGLPP